MTDITQDPEGQEPTVLEPVAIGTEKYQSILNTLQAGLDRPGYDPGYTSLQQGFAQSLVDFVQPGMSYEELRSGGATDQDIIETFAVDDEGRPFAPGTFMEGVKRRIAAGAAAVPAFLAGARGTNLALSPISPVNPATAAVRLVGPIVGGGIAAYKAMEGGDYLTDLVLGSERSIIPGAGVFNYELGKAMAENAPAIFLPYFLAGKTNLGARALLDNVTTRKVTGSLLGAGKPQAGKDYAAFAPTGTFYRLPSGKVIKEPVSLKATKAVENMIARMRKEAFERPITFLGIETAAAGSGTVAAAGAREEELGPVAEFTAETGAAIGTGLAGDFIIKRLSNLLRGFTYARNKRREAGGTIGAIKEGISSFRGGQQDAVANFLADYFERFGEEGDLDEAIKNLTSDRLDDLIGDWARNNPDQALPVTFTSGVKSRSPILLALEKAAEDTVSLSGGGRRIARQRAEAAQGAGQGIKLAILGMYGTGDPGSMREAAELAQDTFEASLQTKLDLRVQNLVDSLNKVAGRDLTQGSAADMQDLGERVREVVLKELQLDRAKESYLWESIPTGTRLTKFSDSEGNEIDVPNVVTFWDRAINPDFAPEADSEIYQNLSDLIKFSNRVGTRFNRGSPVPPASTPKEVRQFDDMYEQAAGADYRESFDRMVEMYNLDDASNESLKKLTELSGVPGRNATPLGRLFAAKRKALLAQKEADANFAQLKAQEPDEPFLTSGELTSMRKKALRLARQATSEDERRIASDFAAAIELDLAKGPEEVSLPYDLARGYSKALNDTYTRTFLGDVKATDRRGAFKLIPERLARQIFSTTAGSTRVDAIDGLGIFQAAQAFGPLLASVGEDGTRLANSFNATVINDQGVADLDSMRRWIGENKEELQSLPGIQVRTVVDENGKDSYEAFSSGSLFDNMNEIAEKSLSMRGTTINILRQILTETLRAPQAVDTGEVTALGRIDASGVRKWMSKPENQAVLEVYPGLKTDLQKVVDGDEGTLELLNRQLSENNKARQDIERSPVSFYTLLNNKAENPTTQVYKAINGTNPTSSLDALWKVVQDAPEKWTSKNTGVTHTKEEAIKGFRNALLEALYNGNTAKDSTDALGVYRDLFLPNPRAKGKKRLSEWLTENEVFSEAEMKSIEELTSMMAELQNTVMKGDATPDDVLGFMKKMGPGADLILSVLGSAAGTRLQSLFGDTGTASIIAAGRGASAFRNAYAQVFAKAPNVLRGDLLIEALQNPSLMASLLQRGKTNREKDNIAKNILNWAVDNGFVNPIRRGATYGFTAGEEEEPAQEEEPAAPSVPAPDQRSSVRPPAVPTRTVAAVQQPPIPPRPAPTPAPPSVASASTQAPASPATRQRYAALFPNDPASSMIRSQGIGGLLG